MVMEEEWQVICQHSLFSSRLLQLEEICDLYYNGSSQEFTINYLKPVVRLLDDIRSRCEEYYGQKPKDDNNDHIWAEQFENIIRYAIHPSVLKLPLHRGDFYIHISSTIPRTLELKYFHLGDVKSNTLSMTDCILMCQENWTELLRSNIRDRFVYTNCIIWAYRFDRVSWKNLLKALFTGKLESMDKDLDVVYPPLHVPPSPNVIRESSVSPNDIINESASLILNLNFELLHSQVAYVIGSRDIRGGAVLFIDTSTTSWGDLSINSEELAQVLIYFFKIPRESVQQKGCSVVIDARDNLSVEILECVGEAIMTLQVQCPNSVHVAYVLTKKDSLMLLFKSSKIKEKLNFEFQFISSIEKLSREIPLAHLPVNFGGQMLYSHEDWIKFRTQVEPFMTGCRSAAKHAMTYIQELSRNDIGYNVEDCNTLLDLHHEKIKEVLKDSRLIGLQSEGKQLIERLSVEECSVGANEDYLDTLECVKRLYSQMNRVFDRLKELSDKRTTSLEICKSIREFEEESHKIIKWIEEEGIPYLEKNVDNGDSLLHAQSVMEDFDEYSTISEGQMEHSEEVILKGKYLTEVDEINVEQERLKLKLMELNHALNQYTLKYNERKKKIKQSIDFYSIVEKVTERWTAGFKYAAHMNMEDIQTIDGIHRLKSSLNKFMTDNPPVSESELARITELAHYLGSNQVKQAEQVNSRCMEAQVMLQSKQNQINGAETSFTSCAFSDGDESSIGFRDADLSTDIDEGEFHENVNEIYYSESSTSSVTEGPPGPIYCWKEDQKHYDENDSTIAVFDAAMSSKTKERLDYIIGELIETEKEYVLSLEYVLENYMPCMDADSIAPVLKGKKNILFGNIKRIYEFHKRFFSQELESFRHNPLQIGRCFLKWERQFNLYALYNKNKPRSDQLWNDYANIYFQGKMTDLNDKLDLASYLIKPVQRLGKYALLLKDVMACCDAKDPRGREINDAHELMKFQLRHGNDLLAMDAIKNADMNLKEQGCLLRQADFFVHYGKRKRMRRVFLFEQAIIFTKPKKQKAKGDTFSYKHSIKTVDVGLTETIGESGLKFEVWYRRWKKGRFNEAFILQASSPFVKKSWTEDITRILWRQATRNKEYGLTEASTGISVESTPSSIFIDSASGGGSPSFSSSNSAVYSRPRNNVSDAGSPRCYPPNCNKRHSWLSTEESSGSSSIYDLERLPEEGNPFIFHTRPETTSENYKFSTLPRKKLITRSSSANIQSTEMSDSAIVMRRDAPGGFNSNFIRKNIYRNTLHCDPRKLSENIFLSEKLAARSSGRFATQPIILPSKLATSKVSAYAPLNRSDSDVKVKNDFPLVQNAAIGISNAAYRDSNKREPREEKEQQVVVVCKHETNIHISRSVTDSHICSHASNTNSSSNATTFSSKIVSISNCTLQSINDDSGGGGGGGGGGDEQPPPTPQKKISELFNGGRLWDTLGRRLSFNSSRRRNDSIRSDQGSDSPRSRANSKLKLSRNASEISHLHQ